MVYTVTMRGWKKMTLARLIDIKAYNKSISGSIKILPESALLDNAWCNFYKANYKSIDTLAYKMFGSYVLEDVENPLKTLDTITLIEELSLNATMFLETNATYLNRLWEIEALSFSPVENYDRYEDIKDVKSGDEVSTLIKSGNAIEVNKTNGNVSNSAKNNQKEINKSEPTSYNTNLIDTTTTEYTGEADISTTTYNGLTNEKNTTYNNVKDDNTHVYNDVTDTHNAHIHGNIGVTTSTAMATEYASFYTSYNFWVKFWNMYIKFNCKADFIAESEI